MAMPVCIEIWFLHLLQETCRTTPRMAYHEWSMRKVRQGAWTWDAFIRQIVEDYRKQEEMEEEMERVEEKRMKMMEGSPYVAFKEQEKPMDWEDESEDQPEKEDKHPEVPHYRDGMLKKSFWEEQWHMFRECSACQRWSYINKGNPMRMNPGCRGCQAPGCTANRKGGKRWLLKSLEQQKPGLYKDYLEE